MILGGRVWGLKTKTWNFADELEAESLIGQLGELISLDRNGVVVSGIGMEGDSKSG